MTSTELLHGKVYNLLFETTTTMRQIDKNINNIFHFQANFHQLIEQEIPM